MHEALDTFHIIDTIFSHLRTYSPKAFHDRYNSLLPYNHHKNMETALLSLCFVLPQTLRRAVALKHLWWNQTRTIKYILKLLPESTFDKIKSMIVSFEIV